MKAVFTTLFILASTFVFAQVYVNGELFVEQGATFYADDTITVDAQSNVRINGIIQTTKTINTHLSYINTGTTGYVVTPIAPGSLKQINIGANSNNLIGILHNSAGNVPFQLAVRSNAYLNPQIDSAAVTEKAVNKTWHVIALDTVQNATLTFGWNSLDELSLFARNNSAIFHWQHGANTNWDSSSAYGSATNTGVIPEFIRSNITSNLLPGLHYYSIGSTGTLLPVVFINFNAKQISKSANLLEWQVATPLKGAYFDIQRSVNGTDFESIKKLTISSNTSHYSYTDENAFNSIHYYRIVLVDYNNQTISSKIVSVSAETAYHPIVIYPNPAQKFFTIDAKEDIEKLTIINNLGVEVLHVGNYINTPINISSLKSGVYYVQVKTKDKTSVTKLIVE